MHFRQGRVLPALCSLVTTSLRARARRSLLALRKRSSILLSARLQVASLLFFTSLFLAFFLLSRVSLSVSSRSAISADGRVAISAENSPSSLALQRLSSAYSRSSPHAVTIWRPVSNRPCTGSWNSAPSSAEGSLPYLILRDVLIDRRHASLTEFHRMHARERFEQGLPHAPAPPFLRIVFYVSVHLSVKLNAPGKTDDAGNDIGPSARLLTSDDAEQHLPSPDHAAKLRTFVQNRVETHVDYVIHTSQFRVHSGKYAPRKRTSWTKDGMRLSEWQIVVSLRRKASAAGKSSNWEREVFEASRHGVKLSLRIPMLKYNGVIEVFSAAIRLDCITGWEASAAHPKFLSQFAKLPRNCKNARGAAAILGSPLHGTKKRHNMKDIAHFAARNLLGPLPFETVLVTVVPEKTLVEIHDICNDNSTCIQHYESENDTLLRKVASVTEQELIRIGAPRSVFPNVIVAPFCRFGSHYAGLELDAPCSASFYAGQHQNTYFGYTLVSPYHKVRCNLRSTLCHGTTRPDTNFLVFDLSSYLNIVPIPFINPHAQWVATLDLDEFFAPNMHGNGIIRNFFRIPLFSPPRTASKVFDRYGYFWTGGALRLSWLNFRFKTMDQARGITNDALYSTRIPLHHIFGKEPARKCYKRPGIKNGKSAVSCHSGLGFRIHSAVRLKSGGRLCDTTENTWVTTFAVRTWHPRWNKAFSPCEYTGIRRSRFLRSR